MITVATPRDLTGMRSHLHMAHGLWAGDVKHYREANTAHNADHAAPFGNGRIPHQHPDNGANNNTNTEGINRND